MQMRDPIADHRRIYMLGPGLRQAYEAIFGVTARHAPILERRNEGRRAVTRKPGKLHAY